jgi:hypothetical protein
VLRPYVVRIDHNYPMHMIGHDYVCTQFHVGEMLRDGTPTLVSNFAKIVQLHRIPFWGLPAHNFSKQICALVGNYRHEIRARLSVIIAFQAG